MPARTQITAVELVLPSAGFGGENPLPPLARDRDLHEVAAAAELPADMRRNLGYGRLGTLLPCLLQDGYDRELTDRPVPTLVLENDNLRATVLPGLGGRLYSLWHKGSGRELLYRNPVLQPANLALRDAWLAGGVEWNLGSTGHTTMTCEPMHAALVEGPGGEPVLRLWEWERTRDLVYQLDFWLPSDSELLYVGVRLQNPADVEVPAYWWSNIAVPQTPGSRVLVPADQAWHFGYADGLALVDVPGEPDVSYPMRHDRAADFFFELPDGQRRWIASLDESGYGLVQASTARLRGRKLFVWGESAGGHRWQEWLAPGADGHGYAEIQAGLARTQLEHLPMPAGARWDWLEAYGALRVDPALAHHDDWARARAGAETALDRLVPDAELTKRYEAWQEVAAVDPGGDRLFRGSGWGALELARRTAAGDRIALPGTPFGPGDLGDRQRPWLSLVTDGRMPAAPAHEPPDGTLVSAPWRRLLEDAPESWLTGYHLGVARWVADDPAGAVEAWNRSLELAESPWVLRALAVAAGDPEVALRLLLKAVRLAPGVLPLVLEAVDTALLAGALETVDELIASQPDDLRTDGRLRLADARRRLAAGDAGGAERVFDLGFDVIGLREGRGGLLAETWQQIQEALGTDRPLPRRYDFRMST